jgi:hypothetical protein
LCEKYFLEKEDREVVSFVEGENTIPYEGENG